MEVKKELIIKIMWKYIISEYIMKIQQKLRYFKYISISLIYFLYYYLI